MLADALAPALGIRRAAVEKLSRLGSLSRSPAAGMLIMERLDCDAQAALRQWQEHGSLPWEDVQEAMGRLLAQRPCPLTLSELPELPLSTEIPPWSFAWMSSAPAAGQVVSEGEVSCAVDWAARGERLLLGAGRAAALRVEASGPIGRWELNSGHGFGQFFGVRGVDLHLSSSGRCEFILANAFAGPLGAQSFGQSLGSSGVISGAWSMPGPREVHFGRLRSQGITVHGSVGKRFAMPAGGAGLEAYLKNLSHTQWSWTLKEQSLTLTGELSGQAFELKFQACEQ